MFLDIVQLITAVLLITVILMQNKGAGVGATFGGGDSGNVARTKRGAEKGLFVTTIILSIIFFVLALINVILA